jgi:hypothetical protein
MVSTRSGEGTPTGSGEQFHVGREIQNQREQRPHRCSILSQWVFEVVEEEEAVLVPQEGGELAVVLALGAEGEGDLGADRLGARRFPQVNEADSVGEVAPLREPAGGLDGGLGLADPGRAANGDQPVFREQVRDDAVNLPGTADEIGAAGGEVVVGGFRAFIGRGAGLLRLAEDDMVIAVLGEQAESLHLFRGALLGQIVVVHSGQA